MLDEETTKKCEYVFDHIITETKPKEIVDKYIDILGISFEDARYIITHNVTICTYLSMCVSTWGYVCSMETHLKTLLKGTLMRDDEHMFEPINNKDKEILKKYYNFKL